MHLWKYYYNLKINERNKNKRIIKKTRMLILGKLNCLKYVIPRLTQLKLIAMISNLVFFLYTFVIVVSLPLTTTGQNVEVTNRYRLPDDTIPMHYDLKFDFNNFTFDGEVQIHLKVRKPTSSIVLHSKDLVINESATNIRYNNDTVKPKVHFYDNDTEMMHLRFENELRTTTYILTLKFWSTLAEDLCGLFKLDYPYERSDKTVLISTHFQKTSARRAFPCWDEPALKATFNVSLKHYSYHTALSNMPAYMTEYDEKDRKTWTHFETTPLMSTNILAFVVSEFLHISNSDNTIRVWARKEIINDTAYFLHIAEKVADEMERYLNSTVRVPKMDHVVLPEYSSRATENWGLIVYLESAVPYDNDPLDLETKMRNVMVITHETAHQWFGNLVSPAWWKYYWLSEGMATYLKYYITDKMFKTWALMDTLVENQIVAFSADDHSNISHINSNFTTSRDIQAHDYYRVYIKPAMIFWMLSHVTGEDVFRTGLLNYINEHQYSNVTSDDLWEAMQKALDRSNVAHQNFTVKQVMDTWIEQSGYPLIMVTRNYTTGDVTISQNPSSFSNDKTRRKWWIPINYATKSDPDFSVTKPTHWLKPTDESLTIQGVDVDDWLIVNLQHVGYYRVNYDSTNWKRIADYLNTNNYTKIHTGNRIQLLHTAFHLTTNNQLSPAILSQLVNYLQRETNPIVWNFIFTFLNDEMETYLQSLRGAEILKAYSLRLMNSFIETIIYDDVLVQNDFGNLVKLKALIWACQFGHRKCKEEATTRLNAYINDPLTNKVPVHVEYLIFCGGLSTANLSIWDMFFQVKIQNDNLRESLQYFKCAENANILEHYLNLSTTENSVLSKFLSPTEIFLEIHDTPINTHVKMNFLERNFNQIANVTNETAEILDNLIWQIGTLNEIDEMRTFLRTRGINKDSSLHYREKALKEIEKNVLRFLDWLKLNADRNVTVTSESS